jgi:hypothetical protein
MPNFVYVERDDAGNVKIINKKPGPGREQLADDHPDVRDIINPPATVALLNAEELYDILEAKGVVTASDRPRPKP